MSSLINSLVSAASSLLSSTSTSEYIATDTLSYGSLLQQRAAWRQAAGPHSNEYNLYDFPSHNYFRILFHFENGDADNLVEKTGNGWGLLHPTWNEGLSGAWVADETVGSRANNIDYWNYNTAWSYLMMNGEEERATYLRTFIQLLSNINTYSPWYFKSIKGIGDWLERKGIAENKWEERGKITIECLEDSADHRIGTMLDCYRAAVWSHQWKKWIVPANLRKFDMTIIVLSSPIGGIHVTNKDSVINDALGMVGDWLASASSDESSYATANPTKSNYITSYKLFELHNCEIEYGTTKGSVELSNEKGFNYKYNIEISFDDMYEVRYNEFTAQEISDIVEIDSYLYYMDSTLDKSSAVIEQLEMSGNYKDETTHTNTLDERLDSTASSLVDQLLGSFTSSVSNKVNTIVLGNMYGTSIATSLNTGSSLTTVSNLVSSVTGNSYYSGLKIQEINNNIFTRSYTPSTHNMPSNIFTSSTLMNS